MIYPNIHIIDSKTNIYFHKDGYEKTDQYWYLKEKFKIKKNEAIVILSQIIEKYDHIIDFLLKKQYQKIYFFIDDVFRDSLNNLDSFNELTIIKNIINKINVKNYKIFHCEKVNNFFQDNINHIDLFLADWCYNNYYSRDFCNYKSFKYKFSCLNNRKDFHRHYISALLCKNKDSFITLNDSSSLKTLFNNKKFELDKFDNKFKNLLIKKLYFFEQRKNKFRDKANVLKKILPPEQQNSDIVYKHISNSFINIVTETTFTSNFQYISEKSIKPMLCYRPFIMIGPAHNLKLLKDLGFKTFNNWWDESYDDVEDHHQRFKKIYNLIDEISRKDKFELEKILKEMNDILIYNHKQVKKIPEQIWSMFFI